MKFYFDAKKGRFLKFSIISWYGYGGGLQYFNAKYTEDTSSKPPVTGKGKVNHWEATLDTYYCYHLSL